MADDDYIIIVDQPEYSDWRCYLFGSTQKSGISWVPVKGQEPNIFHRWMQRICFGNKWIKEE